MTDSFRLQSVVTSPLMRYTLFKGCGFAVSGMCVLLIGGIFLPPETLGVWGWLLFVVGIGLMTFGMLPYKRLLRIQLKPDELVVQGTDLEFYSRGIKRLTIPLRSIEKIAYRDARASYGISFRFLKPVIAPVIIHGKSGEIEKMKAEGRKFAGADLFIPRFNRKSFDRLKETISIGNKGCLNP